MIVECVFIGTVVSIALTEIYYGWKLNQERKIIKILNRARESAYMFTFDEEKEVNENE